MRNIKVRSRTADDFILPGEIIPMLPKLNELQLKAYIYAMSRKDLDVSAAAEALGVTAAELEGALDFLCGADLLTVNDSARPITKPSDLLQSYDGETLAKAMEKERDFAMLKDSAEEMLGKMLNKNDISLLYNLYHFSGLSADYVCTVIAYAVAHDKTNMRYITQTALSLYDDGVDSFEKLEAAISARQKRESQRGMFISLCGFGARKLSPKEDAYIARWFDEFGLPFEVVRAAYEKMIDSIGEVKLPYMDKIVTDWYEQGVKTREAAIEAQKQRTGQSRAQLETSFDVNEFISAAMSKAESGT